MMLSIFSIINFLWFGGIRQRPFLEIKGFQNEDLEAFCWGDFEIAGSF